MKKHVVLLLCCLLVDLCGAQIKYGISADDVVFQKSYPQRKELKRHGGIATFDLTVKNEKGEPIQGANGGACFWYRNGSTSTRGISDENGKLILSNKAKTDGSYIIEKEGFYKTRGGVSSFDAPDEPFGFFERRRWVPVVRDVILKEKRNPIPMYSKRFKGKIPLFNQAIGFDLKVVDWVRPYGKGEVVDMYITIEAKDEVFRKETFKRPYAIVFEWPRKYDGVQVCDADFWSEFISAYSVDLEKPFQKKLVLTPPKSDSGGSWLPGSKYLTFRVRSERSPTGELIQCHYGKIYTSIYAHWSTLYIAPIFFNPTPNDTKLEFDPENNLSPFSCLSEEDKLNTLCP